MTAVPKPSAALLLLALLTLPMIATAADEACTRVTQKCTKDKTYDKTIRGSIYRCYDCTQALCKDGGNGGISGAATSSVCTEKTATFQPISLGDQSRGGDTLAPKPRSSSRPDGDARRAAFDEADALFGTRRTASGADSHEQRDHRTGSAQQTRDHREPSVRTNTAPGLQAPSDLVIRSVSPTALVLAWQDNSTDEFGVEVYRAEAAEARRDPKAWKLIGTFQERILDNVAATGMRADEDTDLSPGAIYCYRMRSYTGFQRTHVSAFSGVACTPYHPLQKSPSPR